MLDVNNFDELRIGLATEHQVRMWSNGEVKKPETINYRTLKPEKDGLFCEKIFGPTRDWECYCGKYKRVRFKGIICERCGVEVTRSKVRRERMGHIELAAPVTHIWYFKGVPSRLGYLLDLPPKDLEKVIYFAAYLITSVDDGQRHEDLPTLEAEVANEKKQMEQQLEVDREQLLKDLENELAELEEQGAKSDQVRKKRREYEKQIKDVQESTEQEVARLEEVMETFKSLEPKQLITDELLYRELYFRFGEYFKGGMGAEAIRDLLGTLDFDQEAAELREVLGAESEKLRSGARKARSQKATRAVKRLKVVEAFRQTGNDPTAMVLKAVPVIPPDLRPMVQLDGGRFATSDLNDLYRRVINRNNRLKRLLDLGAPEIIVNNEKRMLQEAVDALFDNGRRGRPVTGPGNRPLKSLSDMLKGKQGRFRQNLLGKRVDYSGRSVIVVGPQLELHQCGLPKQMALELFKPFVMKRLVDLNYAQNIKSAKRMVERARPQVWDVLEEVIADHPVMLNRAPTLHRLGIQAFEPVLVEGKAIQIHPLVCAAFNADFDGDQMAVHLPLSSEAQAEARVLMMSSNNILSPAHGRPLATPSQDMVLGSYYLTFAKDADETGAAPQNGLVASAKAGETFLPSFSNPGEVEMSLDLHEVELQQWVLVRLRNQAVRVEDNLDDELPDDAEELTPGVVRSARGVRILTTPGRVILNEALPEDMPFENRLIGKKEAGELVNRCADNYTRAVTAQVLDRLKDLGFRYATRAGVTVSIADVEAPPEKQEILAEHDEKALDVEKQFRKGIITDEERKQELRDIWTEATNLVADKMEANFDRLNPVFMMANSGARGSMTQIRQLAAMKGLVSNPRGEIIERPIKSNFREGLSVLEYFISTHGARKGLADTALRTADSGYLTRRLVDIAQDLIVREDDCGTRRGMPVVVGERDSQALFGRVLGKDVHYPGTEDVLMPAGTELTDAEIRLLRRVLVRGEHPETGEALEHRATSDAEKSVTVRTVLTCDTPEGVCVLCYGRALAEGQLVQVGEAVGIIAAQSIGEPGTQLTMRTFHTGGVASGEDITQGLPRVVELFEARSPKGKAEIAHNSGVVSFEETDRGVKVTVEGDDEDAKMTVTVPNRQRLLVSDGQEIKVGEMLTGGSIDPHEMLEVLGARETQRLLVGEVQEVYGSQGVSIHDKHIELIVRQMLRRVNVVEPGDTPFLPGELVDRTQFADANRRVLDEGGQPGNGRQVLMGITKASLATESWLSAASFQETTRVLTEAAIEGKKDSLIGLKENVIIGKLIPAGTGLRRYRGVRPLPTEVPEQVVPADLIEQFGADGYDEYYEADEGWTMGEESY
ncbi:DNA-directed RNA polymerase subunit beta' [Egibacter rhizosphaerae]|uniref:DNA-directed RNA polymerase subunit beta' n=1 Tax=Egibacter rhizosphaerae TaxID=1670831 RepID=A0A411YH60_9ACTN|nr:DNA-directed RNA polymerase subunit beta' [Egibacter rhizosphaerae]QBI20446.1 DNA-directed RNA polymerase subunit beta' [Egibacter rhizosphaerae]